MRAGSGRSPVPDGPEGIGDSTLPAACAAFDARLADALDPSSDESDETLAHGAACPRCRAALEETRSLLSEIASVEVPDPGLPYWRSLSSRTAQLARKDERVRRLRAGLAVAAAFLLAAVLLTLGDRVLVREDAQEPVAVAGSRATYEDPATGEQGQPASEEEEAILDSFALFSTRDMLTGWERARDTVDLAGLALDLTTVGEADAEDLPAPFAGLSPWVEETGGLNEELDTLSGAEAKMLAEQLQSEIGAASFSNLTGSNLKRS